MKDSRRDHGAPTVATQKLKSAAALVFAMSLVLIAWESSVGKTVELEGHLYTDRDADGTPGTPVAGAVVSTSLSSATAVTDEHGRFQLRTGKRVPGDEYYAISVHSGGRMFRQRSVGAPMKGSDFILTPPDAIRFMYPPPRRSR